MNTDSDTTEKQTSGSTSTTAEKNENYRTSHQGQGSSYHSHFSDNPRRKLMWSIEQRILASVVNSFPAGTDIDYLDFACGTGRVLAFMEEKTQKATGVDVSKSMLEVARKNVKRAEVVEADLTRTTALTDRKFDLITAFRFFPNAENQLREDAMNAVAKRLKPGGIFVFNNHKSNTAVNYRFAKMFHRDSSDRRMSKFDVQQLISSAGLSIRNSYPIGILPDYESRPLRPRFLVSLIEKFASRLPISFMAENIIYVCKKDSE